MDHTGTGAAGEEDLACCPITRHDEKGLGAQGQSSCPLIIHTDRAGQTCRLIHPCSHFPASACMCTHLYRAMDMTCNDNTGVTTPSTHTHMEAPCPPHVHTNMLTHVCIHMYQPQMQTRVTYQSPVSLCTPGHCVRAPLGQAFY